MLRLSPTTLSLTVTEVKDFERHLRFKKYLAKEDTFGQLVIRPKKDDNAAQKSTESERGHVDQTNSETAPNDSSVTDVKESSRLLSYPPRRPPKSGDVSAKSGSLSLAHSSPSRTPSSLNTPQPTGWGNLPMTLPPPFSKEKRTVSDAQSLPSTHQNIHGQSSHGDASQDPPMTPPRRSSLRLAHTEIHSSSPPVRGRMRFVSSAVRFMESMIPSPRRGSTSPSPLPSPHVHGPDSESPPRETELGFRIYNDALPASSQPQTPHNLPEARHRSRLYGSYTAPHHCLASVSSHRSSVDRAMGDTTGSPSGLETPGFQGLYGGRENGEDSTLFHEASRYRDEGFGEEERG
ncbi:uncharacterized protein GGS22DRAFT_200308 [Annulohypoxylon maeteangense]|uniref:uncharacterized protein n=1 Tax=Annulohypoxylon maeteangense TaxID=1927788 RepID=UPI002007E84E|nr:uncharacterized protein GGS22DRAFT_200308 [Annulohypoxylon maeteangense]KAI0884512.1 hypothetical protein GGS22DRAFT_200308 [Annulohypoxylon maeteangense]